MLFFFNQLFYIELTLSSVLKDDNYNWLICEGSSDRIYLEEYLRNEVTSCKLRIVPVCKAKEVKKIYKNIALAIEDLKESKIEMKGKVFLLVDTDKQFSFFESKSYPNLRLNRIVNNDKERTTKLVDYQNDLIIGTDIEDALNGKVFNIVLNQFKSDNADLLDFVSEEEKEEIPSYFAMDLKQSERAKLDEFLSDYKKDNKVRFAKKYVEELNRGNYAVPKWIEEIKRFFSN